MNDFFRDGEEAAAEGPSLDTTPKKVEKFELEAIDRCKSICYVYPTLGDETTLTS